jgi:hypothetical protein
MQFEQLQILTDHFETGESYPAIYPKQGSEVEFRSHSDIPNTDPFEYFDFVGGREFVVRTY